MGAINQSFVIPRVAGDPSGYPSALCRSPDLGFRASAVWLGRFVLSNDLRGSAQEVAERERAASTDTAELEEYR